ncbi:MAG TPA: glycosyltransferase family 1 protein [Gammaproteobacteria bacterium]|nr:glycosyltransferase family 1 protein [Gammaproteobacteria bacterium]
MSYSHAHAQPSAAARVGHAHDRPFVMIDGFNIGLAKGTGVATYARNLSNCLRSLDYDVGILYGGSFSAKHSQLLKEVLFFDAPSAELTPLKLALQALKAVSLPGRHNAFEVPITGAVVPDPVVSRLPDYDSIWNAPNIFVRASQRFRLLGVTSTVRPERMPNLCHWTYPLPVRVNGVPNIYTLHDLVPLRLPHTTLDQKTRYLKLVRWICRTADHIVTVSENSKRDIVELLGVDPARVTNTYQAVSIPDTHMSKPEDVVRREVEGTFGLDFKEYFVFFGSIEPKKNIGRLIESYLASGVQTPLVIVGAQAWKSEQELSLLPVSDLRAKLRPDERQRGPKILKIEYVPYGMLINLIRGAKATLFPSLYEGFGLPVLESMLLGTPVLTSRTSSVPEVAGNAALLVDPYDVRDLAEGIRALDTDPELRAELAARGRQRAGLFDEAAYSSRLAPVYESLLERKLSTRAA